VTNTPLQPNFADQNKLSSFYLGREYDLSSRSVVPDQVVEYESKDLCTHGVVVGMTGSGKTGLSLTLLEEAAIDGIPCIMVDPKGDLSNLLLQFPELRPDDFKAWLNPDEAEQKGITLDAHAEQLAQRWRQGLEETGQSPARIRQLLDRSEFRIYTPGSEAGLPLSILQNFKAPKGDILREDLNQKIDATASALLGLTGTAKDPVQSREHVLIAQLLLNAWTTGRDLDLHQLIEEIQEPPVQKVGALELETFYKKKDRLKLAVALNNILASPSFSTWLEGDPLDLASLLVSPSGKARQLIFSVAHLDDAQRMFFITLLLAEVLSWTRKQSGSSNLRAILYFDEVFGYLPPHPGNPPTKQPLMTLLKQARAFGVGVLLATQNPVDIDYKALSNAGTWFIGKLQTERDKARLLEGLEGAAAERGARADRAELEKTIASLSNRVFLLHNIHRGGVPRVFQTRWALSFLRGPMTREEISRLMKPVKEGQAASPAPPVPAVTPGPVPASSPLPTQPPVVPPGVTPVPEAVAPPPDPAPTPAAAPPPATPASVPSQAAPPIATPVSSAPTAPTPGVASLPGLKTSASPPALPGDIRQVYLPVKPPAPVGNPLVYRPFLLGMAEATAEDRKMGRKYTQSFRLLLEVPTGGQAVDWSGAEALAVVPEDRPPSGALWVEVPDSVDSGKKLKALEKSLAEHVAALKVKVPSNPKLSMTWDGKESLDVFQGRCQTAAWKEFEKKLGKEKETYGPEFARYQVSVPEAPVDPSASWSERWQPFLRSSPLQRTSPPSTLSPKDRSQLEGLENEWHDVRASAAENWKQIAEQVAEMALAPKKGDVKVTGVALAWVPFWAVTSSGDVELVAAYR
jgi:Helicase HerA-like C-terminal